MAKAKKKTKAEELQEAVAEAVGAGREVCLESVDFSDPNRPKTCLEVDFPILPINHVAAIEGNAGKPIYQMSKWWAQATVQCFPFHAHCRSHQGPRRSGRGGQGRVGQLLRQPPEERRLPQAQGGRHLHGRRHDGRRGFTPRYADVRQRPEPRCLARREKRTRPGRSQGGQGLLDHIEAEVKPQIMPFYACDCPRGHKGKWTRKSTGKVMGKDFDPLALKPEERPDYEYEGPEVIYTFWAKHGPCQATECDHRTPIMSSPVVAVKTLTVKAWIDRQCTKCGETFDIERHEARMAPAALFVRWQTTRSPMS